MITDETAWLQALVAGALELTGYRGNTQSLTYWTGQAGASFTNSLA